MKKNLEILEIEPKLDKNEKKFWRVKTNEGWMTISSWDETTAKQVKAYEGSIACLEVTEREGTNYKGEPTMFKNIKKCYGEAERNVIHKIEGEEIRGFDEKPEVVKMFPEKLIKKVTNGNNHATMYTSYAKDIFCALVEAKEPVRAKSECIEIMQMAISLVKQAKDAFE